MTIANPLKLLTFTLLLLPTSTMAGFWPFLGCDEEVAWGVPAARDCYAVDSYVCSFSYTGGCRQTTASYEYYIGGQRRDGGQTYEQVPYQTVEIEATVGCGGVAPSFCAVTVDGKACNTCSNGNAAANYKRVTLSDCSNIPGVFATGRQTILLDENGGYLELAPNQTRCEHPAITQRRRIPISGEIEYIMDNRALSNPQQATLSKTIPEWFNKLLPKHFSLFQTFQMGTWRSQFFGAGPNGKLTISYDATIILDPTDTTTTLPQLATVMTNTTHMAWYVTTTVRPSSPVFANVTTATGTVVAKE